MALKMMTKSVAAAPTTTVEPTTAVPTLIIPKIQALSETEALTSEFLTLQERLNSIDGKELLKRMEAIRKQLQAVANVQIPDDQKAVFSCPLGEVEFSPRGETLEIADPQGLIAFLNNKFGIDVAFSVVSILLTPLRKILTEGEILQFGKKEPGSRTIKDVRFTSE